MIFYNLPHTNYFPIHLAITSIGEFFWFCDVKAETEVSFPEILEAFEFSFLLQYLNLDVNTMLNCDLWPSLFDLRYGIIVALKIYEVNVRPLFSYSEV